MARIGSLAAALAVALTALLLPAAADAAGLAATKRVLRHEMARAGAYSGAYVLDLDSGRAMYASNASVPRIPASVEKLYTSATALRRFGATGVLTTSAVALVEPDDLPDVVELGFAIQKMGEAAVAPIENYSMEGTRRGKIRRAWRNTPRR